MGYVIQTAGLDNVSVLNFVVNTAVARSSWTSSS